MATTKFTTSPKILTKSIVSASISGSLKSLMIASTTTKTASAIRAMAFMKAAMISTLL